MSIINSLNFIDVETTGTNHEKNEIFDLAFTIEINKIVYCSINIFMRPERWDTISDEALKTNGWTVERLKRLPDRDAQLSKLRAFFEDSNFRADAPLPPLTMVEYGNRFDYRFMQSFCGSKWFSKFMTDKSINVLSMARKSLTKLKSFKLYEVASYLGIHVNSGRLHGAAYDRDLMIEVFYKLGGVECAKNMRLI